MYKLTNSIYGEFVLRLTDYVLLQLTDQAYLAWLAEGNTPLPAENT